MIDVLVISGKEECVEMIRIERFENEEDAAKFVDEVNEDAEEKYYRVARIVCPGTDYAVRGSCCGESAEIREA